MAAKVSTNGPNGTASITKGPVINEPPVKTPINESASDGVSVTKTFSRFVSDTTWEALPETIVEKLKELLLDHIGVASHAAYNAESSEPFLKAIVAFGGSGGENTVYTKGQTFPPQHAALLNGAFGHTYDYDDTFAKGAMHPGVSVIPAAIAQSETSKANGKTLLTALAVGYEVKCRLSMALGTSGYERGFHTTGTAGVFGAVAAVCKVKNLPAHIVEAAFGLAGSKAAGSMQYLENGSWNKRLHGGFAAHDALLCVVLAETGVMGAAKAFEGKSGFLHAYSERPNLKGLVDNLGSDWTFTSTALKPWPACRMTHAAIELAAKLSQKHEGPLEHITVGLSKACYNIVGTQSPKKIRSENIVDAQFSCYTQTAIAWLDGCETGWAIYDRIYDEDVREVASRVRCVIEDDIDDLGARVMIRWQDGTERTELMQAPLGEESYPFTFEKVKAKYLSMAQPVYGPEKAVQISETVKNIERCSIADLTSLL
jgi:2-methylcitrate dehydratase PrpD